MSTTCPWSGRVLAASALSFAAGVLGAARFPTRASATSIANIDSFLTVALFGGIGLLLSLSVWSPGSEPTGPAIGSIRWFMDTSIQPAPERSVRRSTAPVSHPAISWRSATQPAVEAPAPHLAHANAEDRDGGGERGLPDFARETGNVARPSKIVLSHNHNDSSTRGRISCGYAD